MDRRAAPNRLAVTGADADMESDSIADGNRDRRADCDPDPHGNADPESFDHAYWGPTH
jgi:hypothetical protein